MNRKTTGILAGTAGAALLIGGGTFALWSDSADVDGATITTGNLQIEASEAGWTWYDSSDAETAEDLGEEIDDLTAFRVVPGDTLTGVIEFSAALEGTNLTAELAGELGAIAGPTSVATPAVVFTPAELAEIEAAFAGSDVELQYFDDVAGEWVAVPTGVFYAADNPAAGPTDPTLPIALPATANVRAVVTVEFDADERVSTLVQAVLDESTVTLTQVRN